MNSAQYILVFAIRVYRWAISPAKTFVLGPLSQCRFTPTCSAYALEAVMKHGALAGSWLALKRLARCHPWGGCGEDPVPARPSTGKTKAKSQRHTAGELVPAHATAGQAVLDQGAEG